MFYCVYLLYINGNFKACGEQKNAGKAKTRLPLCKEQTLEVAYRYRQTIIIIKMGFFENDSRYNFLQKIKVIANIKQL